MYAKKAECVVCNFLTKELALPARATAGDLVASLRDDDFFKFLELEVAPLFECEALAGTFGLLYTAKLGAAMAGLRGDLDALLPRALADLGIADGAELRVGKVGAGGEGGVHVKLRLRFEEPAA